ncbi:type II/IV secretion system protein [Campylobacter peloridis]|uniref:Type II/IV secretion system protein n=1 Tax=Campylobacter peloridis TaxID=488546 RepID=A0A5C7DT75_9BACT|nr:GspE/PulE family protein [Campylobacter peloridis]TXE78303.1 type II/IV secretion system protein [Campylobacter peloridis]
MLKLNDEELLECIVFDKLSQDELYNINEQHFKNLAKNYGLNFLDLNQELDFGLYLNTLPLALVEKYHCFCFNEDDENIYIVSFKPLEEEALTKIQNLFRFKNIIVYISAFCKFQYFFEKIKFLIKFQDYSYEIEKILQTKDAQDNDIVENFLFLVLSYASFLKASDIHFEPLENEVLIRFRIDGILNSITSLSHSNYQALLLHIKIISLLNVAEQRNAQDSSFSKEIFKQKYDFRISIMPLLFGQSVVVRILKQEEQILSLEQLFIDERNLQRLSHSLNTPYGLILFCGPTGSGKSTFMHTILNQLDKSKKIITLEDPIEYKLKHAQQILLNTKAGFDFKKALRGVLRQDPDVIMIGEIRDEESLDIVLKASLSGHLVLSTLHTNNALEAIFRMLHMGAKSYLIACSVNLIISQRLVRRLCECKEEIHENILYKNEIIKEKIYKAKGCAKCMMSGYKGRIMIAEFLFLDQNIKTMIENNSSYELILNYALKNGLINLSEDALEKVKMGLTSLEEIKKVVV